MLFIQHYILLAYVGKELMNLKLRTKYISLISFTRYIQILIRIYI